MISLEANGNHFYNLSYKKIYKNTIRDFANGFVLYLIAFQKKSTQKQNNILLHVIVHSNIWHVDSHSFPI